MRGREFHRLGATTKKADPGPADWTGEEDLALPLKAWVGVGVGGRPD